MLARIKALKEEEEAKAKAAGKVVAPPVDVPKKAANKTKVTPIKQPSLGARTRDGLTASSKSIQSLS